MAYFYSHIIKIDTVIAQIDELNLTGEQKKHLSGLLDSTIHLTVLDVIMTKLGEEDKKYFVVKFQENPQDKHLFDYLVGKVENLEKEIQQAIGELNQTFLIDIEEAKELAKKGLR